MDPIEVYQSALDVVSRAVMTGDTSLYLSVMSLPYAITTHTDSFVVTTEAELSGLLVTLSDNLRARSVTDYVRIARKADYLCPDAIEGLHFTHMLRDGERIAPPHAARQRIVRSGGVWRFVAAFYGIENAALPLDFPRTSERREVTPGQFQSDASASAEIPVRA